MRVHPILAVAIFLACLSLCAGEVKRPEHVAEPAEQKFLRQVESALDALFAPGKPGRVKRFVLDKTAIDRTARLAVQGPAEACPRANAALGRIRRQVDGDPVASLMTVAQFVLPPEILKKWKSEFDQKQKAALAKWEVERKSATLAKKEISPKPERQLFAAFPTASEWTINDGNFRCIAEAGLALLQLTNTQAAIAAFKALGEKFRMELPGALAAEGAGDAFLQPTQYEKAVGFYEYAIKLCEPSEGHSETERLDLLAVRSRLHGKLTEARRLWDMERYGEGFVLYREAEILRRRERKFAEAHTAYQTVIEKHPQTVYSEASRAYQLKCLLILSEPEAEAIVRQNIAELEKALQDDEKFLKLDQCGAVGSKIRDLMTIQLDAQRSEINALKAVPLGKAALAKAEANLADFLKSNEFGLYRGEALLDFGCHKLERNLDLEAAKPWLEKAERWLGGVEQADANLAAFDVPDKAKSVAATPKTEKSVNPFGSAEPNEVALGAIANRKTCEWYLPKLRRELRLRRGFAAFMSGKSEDAKKDLVAMLELDPTVRMLQQRNFPNAYRRLMEDCERGYFWGWPEDLKAFSGARRTAVFLAGFFFETNDYARAQSIYDALLAGLHGALSPAEEAFVAIGKGECLFKKGAVDEAKECFERAARKYQGTPTEPKALFSLANTCLQTEGAQDNAIAAFRELHQRFPNTAWGEKGLYHAGFVLAAEGKPAGEEALKDFVKRYPKSIYVSAATKLLEQYAPGRN